MESSFFEYRDQTGALSDSDTEIIDDSMIDDSMTQKKPAPKNHTVFVAESEESSSEGEMKYV